MRLDADVSLDVMAERTEGYSGDDLTNISRDASMSGMRRVIEGKSVDEIKGMKKEDIRCGFHFEEVGGQGGGLYACLLARVIGVSLLRPRTCALVARRNVPIRHVHSLCAGTCRSQRRTSGWRCLASRPPLAPAICSSMRSGSPSSAPRKAVSA